MRDGKGPCMVAALQDYKGLYKNSVEWLKHVKLTARSKFDMLAVD